MANNYKKEKRDKFILKVLLVSALLILVYSMEALMLAKDVEVYREIHAINQGLSHRAYLTTVIGSFLIRVVSPVAISLYTFFMIHKTGVNLTYKIFFAGMTLIELVNIFFQFRIGSIFYYIEIILNIILLFIIGREERM
ncbi:hypothetical protein [Anaerococcus sp. AGMB09787]|uniref:hypothetical protein n=1 Tax=Anaerococcus sp. AGMB09787 TaxID=2922869 RepID=UPI001FB00E8A|nr:hypothetical protein [Anaerococcus sp. AGMB09787]